MSIDQRDIFIYHCLSRICSDAQYPVKFNKYFLMNECILPIWREF